VTPRPSTTLVLGTWLLALAAAGGCQRFRPAALPDTDPLPLLALPTLAGETLDPQRYQGKVVVVNFWSPG
jgi:hypothetical protein